MTNWEAIERTMAEMGYSAEDIAKIEDAVGEIVGAAILAFDAIKAALQAFVGSLSTGELLALAEAIGAVKTQDAHERAKPKRPPRLRRGEE